MKPQCSIWSWRRRLFRAVDWQHIRRLILVGDPGQLPPIGRGRVFADVIRWMSTAHPANLGRLGRNLRQLLNKVRGEGTAIVALSELFIVDDEDKSVDGADSATRPDQEALIARIHAGGAVDRDLDVIYWDEPERAWRDPDLRHRIGDDKGRGPRPAAALSNLA